MRIIKKQINELTPSERSDLRRATISTSDTGMRDLLKHQKQEPHIYKAFVFMLYAGKKLIAWSAIVEPSWSGKRAIWVYTKRKYRRAGLGTTLYKLAKRKVKRFRVEPWNETGYQFFKANNKSFEC